MLDTDQRPQERRLRGCVLVREPFDFFRRQPHGTRDIARGVLPGTLGEAVVSNRVTRHVVVVDQAVADHHVHHRERQHGIARGLDLQMPIRRLGSARPDRIDDHDLRAAALRLAHNRPVVQVRDDRVGTPEHDVAAVDRVLGVDPGPTADRGFQPRRRDGAADVSIEIAAAHRSEQAHVDRGLLDQPLNAGGAIRKDSLRA